MDCTNEELASADFAMYARIDTNSLDFTNGQNLDFIPENPVTRLLKLQKLIAITDSL